MKIESQQCKVLKSTIDSLCTGGNVAFYSVFKNKGRNRLGEEEIIC